MVNIVNILKKDGLILKRLRGNIVLTGILALVTSALISGCGSSNTGSDNNNESSSGATSGSNNSSEKIELTLWHYYNGSTKDILDDMVYEFNNTVGAEKNIFIDAYSHSTVSELASTVVSAANKEVGVDDMPDIFAAYNDTVVLLDGLNVVADLDDYFTEEELSLFHKDFLEEGRFDDGSLKVLPVAKSTELLFINESDFSVFSEETGVEFAQLSTWEGLAEVAEIYYDWTDAQTEEENDGRALFGIDSDANFMMAVSKQLEEEFYDYSQNPITFGLSKESSKKVWDNYIVPYIKGHYASKGSFRSDDVKSGDLLMYTGSVSSIYYFPSVVELGRTESYDIEGIVMQYPYFEDGQKVAVQQGAGMVISKSDEEHEKAAAEFLKWFVLPENNLEFAISTGYMPVQNDALNYSVVSEATEEYMNGEVSNIVKIADDVLYNQMMPEYEFYANKSFDGSYDARNAIRSFINDKLGESLVELESQIESGISKEDAILDLTSDEKFEIWYEQFETTINDILLGN